MTFDSEKSQVSTLAAELLKYFRKQGRMDISRQEIEQALKYAVQALSVQGKAEDHLVISGKKETHILEKQKILYVEREKRDTYIHMEEEVIRLPDRLSVLEERLEKGSFIRCHNSFIVNMNCVKEHWKEGFRMKNDEIIPISRSRQKAVKEIFELWVHISG